MIRSACLALLTLSFASAAWAQSLDLPPRKPGQWTLKMETQKPAGMPAMSMQACVDAVSDKELMEFGLQMGKDKCQRFDVKREGANYVIDADCKIGPVSSKTRTVITGDFQSSYEIRIDGTTKGPGIPSGPTQMTQTGRWLAATCSGGMRPGDIQISGLPKMNIKQLKQMMPMLGL